MATVELTKCDQCGVMADPKRSGDQLPPIGWVQVVASTRDADGTADLCPDCVARVTIDRVLAMNPAPRAA